MIYFTSDQHFGHDNIRNLVPVRNKFLTLEEMTDTIIRNFNARVRRDDTVYLLGDFYIGDDNEILESIVSQLKGHLVFIQGNHDSNHEMNNLKSMGKQVNDLGFKISLNHRKLMLTHFPLEVGKHGPYWSIHGHIHQNKSSQSHQINVCVDSPLARNKAFGEPFSIDEIEQIIRKRSISC